MSCFRSLLLEIGCADLTADVILMQPDEDVWVRRHHGDVARPRDDRGHRAWSVRMEGYGGPAQPSPTIGQCISGGLGWLEVECNRCKTRASLPLDAIRRPRDTPIWKLEASLKCRSCRAGRYAPPVRMIKLTERQEITPYKWVHPSDER